MCKFERHFRAVMAERASSMKKSSCARERPP